MMSIVAYGLIAAPCVNCHVIESYLSQDFILFVVVNMLDAVRSAENMKVKLSCVINHRAVRTYGG
jgi:hypothetical protein